MRTFLSVISIQEKFHLLFLQICANTGITTTFDELRALTINTAKNLRYYGCEEGDLISFFTKNTADVAPIIFAALCLGAQISAFPAFYGRVECVRYLKPLKPKVLFCDVDIYQKLKQCLEYVNNDAKIFTFDGSTDESIPVITLFENPDADTHLE